MVTTPQQLTETLETDLTLPPVDLWSDEPPLESDFHRDQIDLLIGLLKRYWSDRTDFYVTGNLTIYYNEDQLTNRDFRGPDFFVVLGTERKDRKSWVVWGEGGQYPNLIIEVLSTATAKVDKGVKKELYQTTFCTPEYFWVDPYTLAVEGFRLVNGVYEPIGLNSEGRFWSQELELFLGIHNGKLRFFTPSGELILTGWEGEICEQQRAQQAEEQVEQERLRAEQAEEQVEQERLRAEQAEFWREQAEERAERLAAKLRELGIGLD
jgi:Uma2 family endonuclease